VAVVLVQVLAVEVAEPVVAVLDLVAVAVLALAVVVAPAVVVVLVVVVSTRFPSVQHPHTGMLHQALRV